MSTDLSTGQVYAEFDALIRQVEAWLRAKDPSIARFDPDQVRARIVQRIVHITESGYSGHVVRRAKLPLDRRTAASTDPVRIAGLAIDPATGRVSVSWRQWSANLFEFAAAWLDLLAGLTAALFVPAPRTLQPATILLEAGGPIDRTDASLVEFCRVGPIAPLASAAAIIVQTKTPPPQQTDRLLSYARRPFIQLVRQGVPRATRWRVLASHLAAPFRWAWSLATNPITVLVSRDLAIGPMVRQLDRHGCIEAVLSTTSTFQGQPLWAKGASGRRFKLHMLWYSQNFIPKMYVGDASRQSLPAARHMRIDVHWVWTPGFADYLKETLGPVETHVVGPIVWYLKVPGQGLSRERFRIAAFDVTPLPDGSNPFGAVRDYYTVRCITQFVSDVVDIGQAIERETGVPVVVLLKHKRLPKAGRHDSSYLAWLDQLAATSPHLELVDHRENLFTFVADCDMSVSVPYTSTAYVGAALSRPAVYYDPTAEVVPQFEASPYVSFASGRGELEALMRQHLRAGGKTAGRAASAPASR